MEREKLFQELLQLEADFCSALSDPTRLLILYTLYESPRTVNELSLDLNIPQPNISRHLKILKEHGLVQAARQGTSVTYQLTDERLIQALDLLRSVMHDRVAHRASIINFSFPDKENV
ncbi:MAG: ArsR/SmtB family transcription factor [Anaerolineales bacterium]